MLKAARSFYQDVAARVIPRPPAWMSQSSEQVIDYRVKLQAGAFSERLGSAQHFVLDQASADMLTDLVTDAGDGFWEMVSNMKLPFRSIFLEHKRADGNGAIEGILINQGKTGYYGYYMSLTPDGFLPAPIGILLTADRRVSYANTAYGDYAKKSWTGSPQKFEENLDLWREGGLLYTGLTVGMCVLLQNRGMLEETVKLGFTRQERRRAARNGETLPKTRISHITLGEFGLAQREAMKYEKSDKSGKRRAHWVRGHFMRNPSGGLSWRMPHIRGAGPLIQQERRVHAEPDESPSQ